MGTRCNIIIRIPAHTITLPYNKVDGSPATRDIPEDQIILYRHWDGYPAETGSDLVWLMDALQRWPQSTFKTTADIRKLLFALSATRKLNHRIHQVEQYTTPYKYADYEETDSIHYDIEYLYTLTYAPNTDGNPQMTLEIKDRIYSKGWNAPAEDCLKHLRTIELTKPLPDWKAFNSYTVPCGHTDHLYGWIAGGESAYSQVEVMV